MNLKKYISVFLMVSAAAVSFSACSKKETVTSDGSQFPESAPVEENPLLSGKSAEMTQYVNPEYEKLDSVLDTMSDRFKGDVHINADNRDAFLADLHAVLNDEKNYNQNDLGLFYLIDKKHNVGADYVPQNLVPLVQNDYYNISRNDLSLRPDVEEALKVLSSAYTEETGSKLLVSSTYRSYSYQEKLFQKWVSIDGLEEAERESARPGTSQHQLGVAIDFGNIDDSFIETKMGQWLNENSEKYGWSLSFPKMYEDVTGYRWECWHFRYIGKPACNFQKKYFNDVQQYMIEFIDAWKNK